ncbi:hypothetical protein E4T47_05055 [Aureobasidium subglaciale]|nr:hypothetical protein E4T47_05055 [Aureobasidium subglaciale]
MADLYSTLPNEVKRMVIDGIDNAPDLVSLAQVDPIAGSYATTKLWQSIGPGGVDHLLSNVPLGQRQFYANKVRTLRLETYRQTITPAGFTTIRRPRNTCSVWFNNLEWLIYEHKDETVTNWGLNVSQYLGPKLRMLRVEGSDQLQRPQDTRDNYLPTLLNNCPLLHSLDIWREIPDATTAQLDQVVEDLPLRIFTTRGAAADALVDLSTLCILARKAGLTFLGTEAPINSVMTQILLNVIPNPFKDLVSGYLNMDAWSVRTLLPLLPVLKNLTLTVNTAGPIFSHLRFCNNLTLLQLNLPAGTWLDSACLQCLAHLPLRTLAICDVNHQGLQPLLSNNDMSAFFSQMPLLEYLELEFQIPGFTPFDGALFLKLLAALCPKLQSLRLYYGWLDFDLNASSILYTHPNLAHFPELELCYLSSIIPPLGFIPTVHSPPLDPASDVMCPGSDVVHDLLRRCMPKVRDFYAGDITNALQEYWNNSVTGRLRASAPP